jgi:uncharacterized membrane protein YedE/YeeE
MNIVTTPEALSRSFEGGLLIGAGAALLLVANGRLAGISGIASNVLRGALGREGADLAFLFGLLLPAAVFGVGEVTLSGSLVLLTVSGVLVGVGTQAGGGCTSGHGVCGIAHGSRRSIVATLVFMAAAMATVAVVRHLGVA